MPAISFSTLKDKILSGEKKQTIRLKKSDYWLRYSKGDQLIGYWKQRSKGESEQLFESVLSEDPFTMKVFIEHNNLPELAKKDGFKNAENFMEWFKGHYGKNYWRKEYVILRWR